MIVVPMSGWTNTSSIGIAATSTARQTSRNVISPFTDARTAASIPMSARRANSEGLNWNPAIWNHRCAPRALEPSGVRTRRRKKTAPAYRNGA